MVTLNYSWREMKLLQCVPHIILLGSVLTGPAMGGPCFAPQRPFVPSDQYSAEHYTDLIKQDFEQYITDVQRYFRCLDEERARAFREAGEVSHAYGAFLKMLDGD